MKLGIIKRIIKETLPDAKDVPKWFDAALDPLNEFIEKVGVAVQGRLTFADNFQCKQLTQNFTSGTANEINPRRSSADITRAIGVIPLATSGAPIESFVWSRLSDGNISVTFTFTGGVSADCTILILLE